MNALKSIGCWMVKALTWLLLLPILFYQKCITHML